MSIKVESSHSTGEICDSHLSESKQPNKIQIIQDVAAHILKDYKSDTTQANAQAKFLVEKVYDIHKTDSEIVQKALEVHEIANKLLQDSTPEQASAVSDESYEKVVKQAYFLIAQVSHYCKTEQEIVKEALKVHDLACKLVEVGNYYYTSINKVLALRAIVLSIKDRPSNINTLFTRAFWLLPYRDAHTAFEIASSSATFLHLPKDGKQPALEIYNYSPQDWHAYCIHLQKIGEGGSAMAKTCIDIKSHEELCRISSPRQTNHKMIAQLTNHRGIIKVHAFSPLYQGKVKKSKTNPHSPRHLTFKEATIEEKMDGDCHNLQHKVWTLQNSRLQEQIESEETTPIELQLTKEQKREMSLDLLHGLKTMHDRKIMHCDLKPGNMLFRIDPKTQKASACIADFDRANFLQDCKLDGTYYYLAPEAIMMHLQQLSEIDFAAKDVYEFSHIFLEIFADELKDSPVSNLTKINTHRVTSSNHCPKTSPTESEYDACKPLPNDPPIAHFIYKCMSFNPEERPSATEMLQEFEELICQGFV